MIRLVIKFVVKLMVSGLASGQAYILEIYKILDNYPSIV